MKKVKKFGTLSVHGGEEKNKCYHSITVPIVQSATYTFENTSAVIDYKEKELVGKIDREEEYSRYGNPTQRAVEYKLAELEGTEKALLFSSGMSAVTTAILALLGKGKHIIFTSDCYRKTRDFAKLFLAKYDIDYSFVGPDGESIKSAIKKNTQIIFSESPTNPYMHVLDLVEIVKIAKKHKLITMIDSTLATPFNQRPVEFGIDIIIHSATKYLGGHNDLLAGVVAGNKHHFEEIKEMQGILGCVPGPLTCYLLMRGLKTFALRMERYNESGLKVAKFLETHPKVKKVYYPGLKSHSDYKIAKEQMKGFGSLITFEINGNAKTGSKLLDNLKIPYISPSLGGVESLIIQPSIMSFYDVSPEERAEIGIKDNLIRIAVGIEDAEDLIDDLKQALDKI